MTQPATQPVVHCGNAKSHCGKETETPMGGGRVRRRVNGCGCVRVAIFGALWTHMVGRLLRGAVGVLSRVCFGRGGVGLCDFGHLRGQGNGLGPSPKAMGALVARTRNAARPCHTWHRSGATGKSIFCLSRRWGLVEGKRALSSPQHHGTPGTGDTHQPLERQLRGGCPHHACSRDYSTRLSSARSVEECVSAARDWLASLSLRPLPPPSSRRQPTRGSTKTE